MAADRLALASTSQCTLQPNLKRRIIIQGTGWQVPSQLDMTFGHEDKGIAMNRRKAVFTLGGVVVAGEAMAADPAGDVRISTEEGWRLIAGEEANAYHTTNKWLEARLKEVESVKIGSTYADVVKIFHRDGGVSSVSKHRFVHILCPFIKIDVEFEDKPGVKSGYPVPATATVVSISRPYFERGFED